jgi:uncharacterized protein
MTSQKMGSMAAQIKMPYTLTAGRATGTFLSELAAGRIIGSRCATCDNVRVPAQDYCPECGGDQNELVLVPATGELVGFTETAVGIVGLVKLDGTDVPLLHNVVDTDVAALSVGERVRAVWAEERTSSVLDIRGFVPAADAAVGSVAPTGETAAPLEQQNYTMTLDYQHAYGHYYGTLFDSVANDRRIRGVRCPACRNVLVPPREYCDQCFVETEDWIDVPDTGVVQACSVVHIEFMGQRVPPPYVYAEIVLDGTSTRLIHTVAGLSAEEARAGGVKPGSRVQAVWSERTTGSLADVDYFRVTEA